jgi:starvation-inducible DNA-binding protein
MRALRAVPDARPQTVVATTRLAGFPAGEHATATVVDLVTAALHATARTVRDVHDEVDAEDPSTADLLHAVIVQLEKQAWMLSAENRSV